MLLELVSDSNCLEDKGRILVILLFINLAARAVTTELTPSYQPQKGQATAVQQYCRQDLGEVAQAAGIPHAGVPVTLDVVHAGADDVTIVQ